MTADEARALGYALVNHSDGHGHTLEWIEVPAVQGSLFGVTP